MFYLVDRSEDLNPEDCVSDILRDCSGEMREELLCIGVPATKTR